MIKFLRHLFFDDFMLKLLSFVLALLFWLTVSIAIRQKEDPTVPTLSLAPDARMVFRVPVQPILAPGDVRKLKFSPEEVDITIQGDGQLMRDLQTTNVRAFVDLTASDKMRNSTNHVQVTIPVGVTFLRVSPPDVQVAVLPKN